MSISPETKQHSHYISELRRQFNKIGHVQLTDVKGSDGKLFWEIAFKGFLGCEEKSQLKNHVASLGSVDIHLSHR